MTFPSRSGTVQDDCERAWGLARDLASQLKLATNDIKTVSLAGTMTSSQVLTFATRIAEIKVALLACASVVGIQTYAQAQINDNTINVATEFNAMVAAIDNVTSWLLTNFPKTPGTNELRAKLFSGDSSGRTVDVVFSAGATSGFRTQLDALLATIN
jgi:hypothetical protein